MLCVNWVLILLYIMLQTRLLMGLHALEAWLLLLMTTFPMWGFILKTSARVILANTYWSKQVTWPSPELVCGQLHKGEME